MSAGHAKQAKRHPAFRALKGTSWTDPSWDLTKPVLEEWSEPGEGEVESEDRSTLPSA